MIQQALRTGASQASRGQLSGEQVISIGLWGGLAILSLLLLYAMLVWLKRKVTAPPPSGDPLPWTLEGLRELRRAGAIDEAEFQRMRDALVAGLNRRAGAEAASETNRLAAAQADEPAAATGQAADHDAEAGQADPPAE